MEYTAEPQRLCEKLIETIGATSGKVQTNLILGLPELVPDSEQKVLLP